MSKATNGLNAEGKKFFKEINDLYQLQPHHVEILKLASGALDEIARLKKDVKSSGYSFADRYGQNKTRPEATMLLKYQDFFARMCRQLGLDLIDVPDVPRVDL